MRKRAFLSNVFVFFFILRMVSPRPAGAAGPAQGQDKPEAVSLLGRTLYARPAAAD